MPITEKNRLNIFVDSSLSAYEAEVYFNEKFRLAKIRKCPSITKDHTRTRVERNGPRLTARKNFKTNTSRPAHRGRNNILERFRSLPGLAQINKDTENVCSQPSEHDQQK